MQIQSTREVDIDRVIKELDKNISLKNEKGSPYTVVVNKQLLTDASDLLKHFASQTN